MNTKTKAGVLGGGVGLMLFALGVFSVRTLVDDQPILGVPQLALLLVGAVGLVACVVAIMASRAH